MGKVKKVKYFTKEKLDRIPEKNIKLYDKYLRSNIIKNKEVEDSTYKVYKNNMYHFLVFLYENYDDIGLYDEEFFDEAIDIMEAYIDFCITTLENNKKTINNKIAAVSSFYVWSRKRKLIDRHPFDGQLERMKGSKDEKIIASHYLTQEEVDIITEGLKDNPKYDIQDRLIWSIMIESCNRVGAIAKLTLSSLNIDEMFFEDIREKRGKRVEVSFEEDSKLLIEEWLEQRKNLDKLEVDSLLITKFNGSYQPMKKATIQKRVKKIGEIIGLTDFRSHSIRKTASNLIYEQTGDLTLAAEMLNHNDTSTTQQSYIKPKSKADIRKKIAELRNKKSR